jgi:hypothetical protein
MDLFDDDPPVELDPIGPHMRETGIQVYKETWNEFYTWEQDECRRALASLAQAISEPSLPQFLHDIDDTDAAFHFDFEASDLNSDSESDTFIREDFDTNEDSVRYSTLTCFTQKATPMKAYPRYEMCTPVSRNYTRDPLYELDQALFVPYADDLDFPVEVYLEYFDAFSWQLDFIDPDGKYRIFC